MATTRKLGDDRDKIQYSFTFEQDFLQAGQTIYAVAGAALGMERYAVSHYPYNSVPLIEFSVTGSTSFGICSGVVVGPHTILTASHGMFPGGQRADDWDIFMRYSKDHFPNPGSSLALEERSRIHYFNIGQDGTMTRAESEWDYAVIDTRHKFTSWFGIMTEYSGGRVHMTGYPATLHGVQQDTVGKVDRNAIYDVLDYLNFHAVGGNSGGPIWVDKDPGRGIEPYVVGICSTTSWASLISAETFQQIKKWVRQDGYSFGRRMTDDDGHKMSVASDADQFEFRAAAAATIPGPEDTGHPEPAGRHLPEDPGALHLDDIASLLAGF